VTISVVQSVATDGGGGGAAGTWTGTFGAGVTAGDTLFFNVFSYDSGATISAGTPKYNGSAYASASQLIGESSAGGNNVFSATWMYPAIGSGGGTTVNLACVNGNVDGNVGSVAYEVSGLGSSPALDRSAGQSHTGSSATVTSGTTSAIQFAPEFAVGTAVIFGLSPAAPAGFTNLFNSAGGFCVAGYQIPTSSGGTFAYNTGAANANDWTATIATVYAGGAAVSGQVQPLATLPAPRRRPARAYVRFTPVPGANAAPAAVSGQVQPRATIPAPRRRPFRAVVAFIPVATVNAAPVTGVAGTVPALMVNQTRRVTRRDGRVVRH
jgi:hypothetical protein